MSAPSCGARWRNKTREVTHGFFAGLGEKLVKRPKTWLVGTLLLASFLTAGFAFVETETNGAKLFTPTSSQAVSDEEFFTSTFRVGETQQFNVFFTPISTANLLDAATIKDNLKQVIDVRNDILQFQAPCVFENKFCDQIPIPFRSVCVNATTTAGATTCDIVSVGDLFDYDPAAVDAMSVPDIIARLSDTSATDLFGNVVVPSQLFGDAVQDGSGTYTSVGAFQLYGSMDIVRETLGVEDEDNDPEAASMQQYLSDTLFQYNGNVPSAPMRVMPYTVRDQQSTGDEAINEDLGLLFTGYGLLIVYVGLVLFRKSRLKSQAPLALAAALSVFMAIGASFGFVAVLGRIVGGELKFNVVVTSLFIILLGLGVDDAFVIMEAYVKEDTIPKAEFGKRMTQALGRAGAAVVATSLTDFVAFVVGTSSVLPAIRSFCVYAAFGVIFNLFFAVTFFVACLHLDHMRMAAGRKAWCCCVRGKRTDALPTSASSADGTAVKVSGAAASAPAPASASADDEDSPPFTEKLVAHWLPRFTLTPVGGIVVAVAAVALFVVGLYGALKLKVEFEERWFTPDSHRLQDVYDVQELFGVVLPLQFSTGNVDYFALQSELTSATEAFNTCKGHIVEDTLRSWYADFEVWRVANKGAAAATAAQFYSWVAEFVAGDGADFAGDVVFVDPVAPAQGLVAARVSALLKDAGSALGNVDAMDDMRDCVGAFQDLQPRVFTFEWLFTEGTAVIEREIVRNVIIAGAAVLVVTFAILAHPAASVLVFLSVAIIDVELLGFLYYVGLEYNSVTAVNIVLSIGLSVDYTLHVVLAFLEERGTRKERMLKALAHIGRPVLQGGLTSFLSVIILLLSESYVFKVFFRCFALTVFLGLMQGLVVLPVFLAYFGPDAYEELKPAGAGAAHAAKAGAASPAATVAAASPVAPAGDGRKDAAVV